MKKIKLTGKQIRLLLNVDENGYSLYVELSKLLKENKDLPDEEFVELSIENHVCEDMEKMIKEYLDNSYNKVANELLEIEIE